MSVYDIWDRGPLAQLRKEATVSQSTSHDGTPALPDSEPELEFVDDPAENDPDRIEDMPDNEPEWRDDGDQDTWPDRDHNPDDEPSAP